MVPASSSAPLVEEMVLPLATDTAVLTNATP